MSSLPLLSPRRRAYLNSGICEGTVSTRKRSARITVFPQRNPLGPKVADALGIASI